MDSLGAMNLKDQFIPDFNISTKERSDSVRSFIEAVSVHEFDEKHLAKCRAMQ